MPGFTESTLTTIPSAFSLREYYRQDKLTTTDLDNVDKELKHLCGDLLLELTKKDSPLNPALQTQISEFLKSITAIQKASQAQFNNLVLTRVDKENMLLFGFCILAKMAIAGKLGDEWNRRLSRHDTAINLPICCNAISQARAVQENDDVTINHLMDLSKNSMLVCLTRYCEHLRSNRPMAPKNMSPQSMQKCSEQKQQKQQKQQQQKHEKLEPTTAELYPFTKTKEFTKAYGTCNRSYEPDPKKSYIFQSFFEKFKKEPSSATCHNHNSGISIS